MIPTLQLLGVLAANSSWLPLLNIVFIQMGVTSPGNLQVSPGANLSKSLTLMSGKEPDSKRK